MSWVITVDLIESCHISAVNGLRVEAAEVKGFLKGQLTHHCCLPPFSSAHPHLLNLNQGWDAWPFISSVSSGCLFHLAAHVPTTARCSPFSSDQPPISQLKHFSLDPQRYRRGRAAGKPLMNPPSSRHTNLVAYRPCCLRTSLLHFMKPSQSFSMSPGSVRLRFFFSLSLSLFFAANQRSIFHTTTCGRK